MKVKLTLVFGTMMTLALANPGTKGGLEDLFGGGKGGGKGDKGSKKPEGYTVYQEVWEQQPYVEHVPVEVLQPQTFYKDVLVKKPIKVEYKPVTSYVDEWVLEKKPVTHYEPFYVEDEGGKGKKGGIGDLFKGLMKGK